MAGTVPPIEDDADAPEKPLDQVTTYDLSNLTWGFAGFRYNPDDLASRRGLKIYQQMLTDEQVKAVVEFKLAAILARGWQFMYENTDLPEKKKEERISVFETCLRKMRGSFLDGLEGIASGREYGYSMTEKIYGEVEYNGTPYVGINQLLTRDPSSFIFKTDPYGTIVEVRQQVTGQQEVVIDMSRMIHYVHAPKWDSIFGRSDLRAAHRSWYAKDNLVKLELLYLEKFGGGTAVAKRVTDDAPRSGTTDHTKLELALKNISSLRSIVLPKGVELEILYPSSTTQFREAITYHDLAIAKALLVPNLLGLSHTGQTGAFAQSQTQLQAFFWTLNTDANRLEECLNEQLFRDIGDQNWGDSDYPRFKFKKADFEHTKWVMSTWKEMLGIKAVLPTEDDEKFLRELLEMPERDENSVILENPVELRKEEEAKKAQADALAAQQEMQNDLDTQKAATDAAQKDVKKLTSELEALQVRISADDVTKAVEDALLKFGYNPDQPRDGHGRFGEGGGESLSDAADAIAKMPANVRDNTQIRDFPGKGDGYNLYEARKMMPKPSEKIKSVTYNNSHNLHNDYTHIANVDGKHYGISKFEDPDAGDDNMDDNGNIKSFVYAYTPLDNPSLKMTETQTASVSELLSIIRGKTPMRREDDVTPKEKEPEKVDGVVPHGKLYGVPLTTFQRATMRVNFQTIEQKTNTFADSAVRNLAAIIAKSAKRALGDDENMKGLLDDDPTDVAAIDVGQADKSKLRSTYRDLLNQSWKLGANLANNELARARGSEFANATAKFASLLDKASAYFDTQAFRMAGDTSDQVRKLIQQELQNGIKQGKPLKDVRVNIWDRLVKKGMTSQSAVKDIEDDDAVNEALDLLWMDSEVGAVAYLNTLVRTNTFEALNEARYAQFSDPELGDFVVALRYAAVLDNSTTNFCEEMDGKEFATDNPIWDEYRPPNHFNCRSILVPITALDGWDGKESPEPSISPAEGFK